MPIYEYVCQACNHQFEHLVHGSEKPTCPSCGGKKLDKQFSVPAAHTSGGGDPPCSPREGGMCDPGGCGGCGLTGLG